MTIAKDYINRAMVAADMPDRAGWHGMSIDQKAEAEFFERLCNQPLRPVIRRITGAYTVHGSSKESF